MHRPAGSRCAHLSAHHSAHRASHRTALRSAIGRAAPRTAPRSAPHSAHRAAHRTAHLISPRAPHRGPARPAPRRSAPLRAPWLWCCSSAPSPASAAEPIASPRRRSEVAGRGRRGVPGRVVPPRASVSPPRPRLGWAGGCECASSRGCPPRPVWGMTNPHKAALLAPPHPDTAAPTFPPPRAAPAEGDSSRGK